MAAEGSSGFTPCNPHGHCTSVQTDLLWLCCAHTVLLHRISAGTQPSPGSSTRSAMFNLLQPFIIPKMCFSAHKNAKMLIPLPSASDCHHKTGHAGTTETGLSSAALGAEQKIVRQLEGPNLSHSRRLNLPEHEECVLCLPEQPGPSTAVGSPTQHSSTGDATATQLEASAVKSEQCWQENEGRSRKQSGLKQTVFPPLG